MTLRRYTNLFIIIIIIMVQAGPRSARSPSRAHRTGADCSSAGASRWCRNERTSSGRPRATSNPPSVHSLSEFNYYYFFNTLGSIDPEG